jgi:hypothetical protein
MNVSEQTPSVGVITAREQLFTVCLNFILILSAWDAIIYSKSALHRYAAFQASPTARGSPRWESRCDPRKHEAGAFPAAYPK